MSNGLLYHGFRVRGYRVERTAYIRGVMTLTISQCCSSYRCPECGSEAVIRRGTTRGDFGRFRSGARPSGWCWRFPEWSVARAAWSGK